MRIWGTLVASTLLVAGLATASRAQEPVNPILPSKGTIEISLLSGALQFSPSTYFDIQGSGLYYLNSKLEVGADLGLTTGKLVDGGPNTTAFTIGPRVDYNFVGSSKLVPYVGAGLFYYNLSGGGNDYNDTTFNLHGGVKYFLNSNVAAKGELGWTHVDRNGVDDTFGIRAGLAIFLH